MESYTLTTYGGQSVSNNKCIGSDYDGARSSTNTVNSLPNVSVGGDTVVSQAINSKPISNRGTFLAPNSTFNIEEILADYERAFSLDNRRLHICRRWQLITDNANFVTDFANWLTAGRVTSLTHEANNYQINGGALKVAIDSTGGSYFRIYKTDISDIDIADMVNDGALEFLVYFEDATFISSIDVKLGTSTLAYYSKSGISSGFDTDTFVNGWNLISVSKESLAEVGVVDPYSIRYLDIQVNLATSELGDNTFLFGGAWWQDERYTRNYKCMLESFEADSKRSNNDYAPFTINLKCPSGYAESTSHYTLKSEYALTGSGKTMRVNFGGSQDPLPHWRLTLNTITNLDLVILENTTTQESIELDEVWVAGDVVELDIENLRVLKNNVAIDYSDILPSFKVGSNRLAITCTSTSQNTSATQTTNNANLTA